MRPHRRDGGFTLLELLVAISVLALLSVSVARGLRVGAAGFARAHSVTASGDRMRDGRRTLQALVAGAYPAFAQAGLDDRRIAFAGEADELTLVTRLPQALGTPQMVQARIFLGAVAGSPALMLNWRLDLPAAQADGTVPDRNAVIAKGVSSVAIAYFGAPEAGGSPAWQDSWADRTNLPLLVRLKVLDGTAIPSLWPDLVVAPLTTGTTACIYGASDIECRRVH